MAPAPSRSAAAGTLAAVLALVLTAPRPGAALQTVAGAGAQASPTQVLVALVALLAWALAGWSCAVVTLTTGGHLPGRPGRALTVVARRTVPATVRHTVELALGLTVAAGVLTSPASATAGTTGGTTAAASASPTNTTPQAPALDWGAQPTDRASTGAPLTAGPRPAAPGTAAPGTGPPPQDPAARCTDVSPIAPTSAEPATAPAVVVRPGDTLWDLAEQQLRAGGRSEPADADVAASWPSWWAANREAVGDDPHLLLPGTVLHPPPATTPPPGP